MTNKPIKTKKDYQMAINRLEVIFDAQPGTPDGDELEVLGILIDKYEQENYPLEYPDLIDAIKFRMEQLGYSQNDLAKGGGLKCASVKFRIGQILNVTELRSWRSIFAKIHTCWNTAIFKPNGSIWK